MRTRSLKGSIDMATLNVYLADALKAQMESVEGVNWSQIAQDAIRAELAKRKLMNTAQTDIATVAARLKSTGTAYTSGYAAGVKWAEQRAAAEQLEIIEAWDWEADLERLEQRSSGEVFAVDVARDLFEREWAYDDVQLLMGGRITEKRLEGFIEGAMSVWKEAKRLM
jgi:post-segregation antitoxin (ccd killing protein)